MGECTINCEFCDDIFCNTCIGLCDNCENSVLCQKCGRKCRQCKQVFCDLCKEHGGEEEEEEEEEEEQEEEEELNLRNCSKCDGFFCGKCIYSAFKICDECEEALCGQCQAKHDCLSSHVLCVDTPC